MAERLGRYLLERRLANGGMAEVFLARQTGPGGFEKTCVIKRMLPAISADPHFVRMFFDEAKLVAQLNHPNIAQVFDFGEHDGQYFLAMEYVPGTTLRAVVKDHAKRGVWLPAGASARIISHVALALHSAHEARGRDGASLGIIHRDVSPQNVLLAENGAVKLIDFGVAKAVSASTRTATGMIKGKLAYMSPEQLRGEPLDRRSDVFGLGLVLYELLAGRRAYDGPNDAAIVKAAMKLQYEPLSKLRPDTPAELLGILRAALAKDRSDRYATAAELSADLEAFLAHTGEAVTPEQLAGLLPLEDAPTARAAPKDATPSSNEDAPLLAVPTLLGETSSVSPTIVDNDSGRVGLGEDGERAIKPTTVGRRTAPRPPVVIAAESDGPASASQSSTATQEARRLGIPLRGALAAVALVAALGVAIGGAVGLNGRRNRSAIDPNAVATTSAAGPVPTGSTGPRAAVPGSVTAHDPSAENAGVAGSTTVHDPSAENVAARGPGAPGSVTARDPGAENAAAQAPGVPGSATAHAPVPLPPGSITARDSIATNGTGAPATSPTSVARSEGTPGSAMDHGPTAESPAAHATGTPGSAAERDPSAETAAAHASGAPGSATVHPRAAKGKVSFRVVPYAEVFLGSKSLGQTPLDPLELTEGSYTFHFVNPDTHREDSRRVTVSANHETIVKVDLRAR